MTVNSFSRGNRSTLEVKLSVLCFCRFSLKPRNLRPSPSPAPVAGIKSSNASVAVSGGGLVIASSTSSVSGAIVEGVDDILSRGDNSTEPVSAETEGANSTMSGV